jgi:pyruvate,orthophosphate dikinase
MVQSGLPVPPGFTISTQVCLNFLDQGNVLSESVFGEVGAKLAAVEDATGKKFGDPENPLLMSVRSGAAISMPGMMDTILNLGLNDDTVVGLAEATGNERFAWDSYRRFLQMFGEVALGCSDHAFETLLDKAKADAGVATDPELSVDALKSLVSAFKQVIEDHTGNPFPENPTVQLRMAIEAVFSSWDNPRAVKYRSLNRIPHDLGTAVNVQAMVYGNLGEDSGTGVGFTRNPSNGANELYGEYLINAQGEDVVAGVRTPEPLSHLADVLPEVYQQLKETVDKLERHYRDVQDFEFTIERGTLYILQTRTGKRTAAAAVQIAVDLVNEGILTKEEALLQVNASQIEQLLHRQLDPEAEVSIIVEGLPASPGAGSGKIVFTADAAEAEAAKGESVILVRRETSPDDIHGLAVAKAVITTRGGMTSHAAVVARAMGIPCVAGCGKMEIHPNRGEITIGDAVYRGGEVITADGTYGRVLEGEVATVDPVFSDAFHTILAWADEARRMGVRANADTPEDCARALEFGAEGIGLCRTEHMFMDPERLPVVRQMIMARDETKMREALNQLLPIQRDDFRAIFTAMAGKPVTIRLLDPPLHEFLPDAGLVYRDLQKMRDEGADEAAIEAQKDLLRRVNELHETNPMLGLRGCRLGLMNPLINRMQVRAIIEAACELTKEGVEVLPEIMIPLVGHVNELKKVKVQLEEAATNAMERCGATVDYKFGTMIEIPRAALTADAIAEQAEFFSFGTNDLTQMTWGYSRDDAEQKFLAEYLDQGILRENPFEVLDVDGVGSLMRIAVEKGRAARPGLKLGICGEHGGQPDSIEFVDSLGLDYVSCSPFRVPVARIAAAQAAIRHGR